MSLSGLRAYSQRDTLIPSGKLQITYKQSGESELSQAVFVNTLTCYSECELTTVTLNQCMGGAFYPAVQRWTTDDDSLEVDRVAPDTIIASFDAGDAEFRLRFVFEQRDDVSFGYLKGFSGGVVAQDDFSGEIITWDLVPLSWSESSSFEFDCPATLPGVG